MSSAQYDAAKFTPNVGTGTKYSDERRGFSFDFFGISSATGTGMGACPYCSLYTDKSYVTAKVSIGSECISYDQVVSVSIKTEHDCYSDGTQQTPSALTLLKKTRAVEVNTCGEIQSIGEIEEEEIEVDLEDPSASTQTYEVEVDSKTEITESVVSESIDYDCVGSGSSCTITIPLQKTTFTLKTFVKTRTMNFRCGRLIGMTSPSSWTQKGTDQEWTSHMLVDPSGPPPPPPPVCDCSPSHQSLDMTYAEPDGMGGHTYNTIGTVYWEDTPDCRYYNASMIVGGECIMTYDDPTDTWSIEWNGLTFGPSGNCNNPIAYYNEPNNPGHHMITSA